ncbi:MAG: hypothetical protein RBS26_05745 [Sulfuricurvum sp.]|nr:hypothetical protein [Sulfuricurvum sp.]
MPELRYVVDLSEEEFVIAFDPLQFVNDERGAGNFTNRMSGFGYIDTPTGTNPFNIDPTVGYIIRF